MGQRGSSDPDADELNGELHARRRGAIGRHESAVSLPFWTQTMSRAGYRGVRDVRTEALWRSARPPDLRHLAAGFQQRRKPRGKTAPGFVSFTLPGCFDRAAGVSRR
jgi:hypothetical protein